MHVSFCFLQAPAATRKPIVALLCQACCGRDEEVGKLAAQCLSTRLLLPKLRDQTLTTLLSKVGPALKSRAGPTQHTALSVLSALAKRVPDALGPEWEQMLVEFKHSILSQKGASSSDAKQLKERCKSQRLAVEVGSAGPYVPCIC